MHQCWGTWNTKNKHITGLIDSVEKQIKTKNWNVVEPNVDVTETSAIVNFQTTGVRQHQIQNWKNFKKLFLWLRF